MAYIIIPAKPTYSVWHTVGLEYVITSYILEPTVIDTYIALYIDITN